VCDVTEAVGPSSDPGTESAWAVMIAEPGRAEARTVEVPSLGPDDVLVRSHVAGVCRTDLKILHGTLPANVVRYPCTPGHEWSGTIAAVGATVGDLQVGDRVVCEGHIPCGRCRYCTAGETNLCLRYDQIGFTRPGGYAELVMVPRMVVHRLSEAISFESAVLVEPGSCVLRALQRASPADGETIGVVGIGTLGSIALVLARLHAPREVVAYGIREDELELARRLGASHLVDVSRDDPGARTASILEHGLDIVIEAAGGSEALDTATRVVRPGGRVVTLGSAGEGARLDLPADRLMRKDISLIGSLAYTSSTWRDMLRLLSEGRVDLQPLVTHRFPADEFADAFDLMERPGGVMAKVVLVHQEA
jgi:L-iditol 2-dehydrogenase